MVLYYKNVIVFTCDTESTNVITTSAVLTTCNRKEQEQTVKTLMHCFQHTKTKQFMDVLC